MPTNEERREVARKLLGVTVKSNVFTWDARLDNALNVPVSLVGKDREQLMAALHHLSVMIEPEPERTCYNVSDFQDCDCFTCSNCGESYEMRRLEYDIDEYCTLDDAIKALDYDGCYCDVRYCPNCGARVIDDGN